MMSLEIKAADFVRKGDFALDRSEWGGLCHTQEQTVTGCGNAILEHRELWAQGGDSEHEDINGMKTKKLGKRMRD